MAQPVIGLTLDHEPPGGYSKFPWYAIRENYCNAVRRAGGLPILLATRISYRRPVTIADRLVGRIGVAGLSRVRWRLEAEFTVDGALHAEAEQQGLFMRLSTRRPIAIPEPVRRWHNG